MAGQDGKAFWPLARTGEALMLKAIAGILIALWLAGFLLHVAGSFIHLLLVVALAVFLFDLIAGRRVTG